MQSNIHSNFILSPITDILKDAVTACSVIGSGIETYPLCDYIMQSVFLKMTGFQEQKMKCICWELATNDYLYRRTLLDNDDKLGECSTYEAKKKIYKRLITQLKNDNPTINVKNAIDNSTILQNVNCCIKNIFSNTNLSIWAQCSFNEFICNPIIKVKHFASDVNLLESTLQDIHKTLYNHRNKCAHNTQSYQQNLPTLKTLANENYKYENYFLWFALLILIDKIFIELYSKYLTVLENN